MTSMKFVKYIITIMWSTSIHNTRKSNYSSAFLSRKNDSYVCSGCKRVLHVRKLRHGGPSLQLVWCIWSQSRNPALHQPHLAWQGNLSIQILLRRRWVLLCQGFDHMAISIKMEKIALHAFFSLILYQLFISSV